VVPGLLAESGQAVKSAASPLREHEVEVYLTFNTTREDVHDALERSGLVEGRLIGECLIAQVQVYPNEGDDA
jgi:hypothetical protein